ncbi:hypothetical protein [Methylovorus glucosotrophus]|uniref:Uncharacterized protein n=1 Tax=Methylovorus glucosotrophus (strain SIP3-4) TaxID=582744 RepID=C6X7Y0_METGS|nr:hypothetical protein [Methylovorus glucosotrophus]ACT51307.1 hypothetical protein Msip34_2065 [Methylovorus glucosotrophus SIP3-4]
MDLTTLLIEWNDSKYLKHFYSSFEEYSEIQLDSKAKEVKPLRGHYDDKGFRVLGREGLMDDSSVEQLKYFGEIHSKLHNNDYDPNVYERIIEMQKQKELATKQAMKTKLEGFQNGTI